jgi:hypothetical protein
LRHNCRARDGGLWENAAFARAWQFVHAPKNRASLIFLLLIEGFSMSQFRLARLCVMLAAVGLAPALMNTAFAQKNDKPAAEQKGPSVRPEIAKLMNPPEIQQLLAAKNYAEVQNRITQADALPNPTPYETYVINRMKLSLGTTTNNHALAVPALESVLNSGFLNAAEKDNFTLGLAGLYYEDKNYPKAIEWFKRYQSESKTPEKVRASLVRAYYLAGDFANAKTELMPIIAEADKTGATPSEQDLRLLASAAGKAKDMDTYLYAIDRLIAHYPNDVLWTDALSRGVEQRGGLDDADIIDLYRLMFAAVQKMQPQAYTAMADRLLQLGSPTEAKQVMEAGFANGVLGTGTHAASDRQLRAKAAKGAADDAKSIGSGEATAEKLKSGAGLVNLGWAYVTMGQFDKGINLIQQGIAKGGLKQPDEAKVRLGEAYAKAGRKDDAIKTLQEVKAPGLVNLAKYWIILINHPTGAPGLPLAAK